jgi:hypothetical protein
MRTVIPIRLVAWVLAAALLAILAVVGANLSPTTTALARTPTGTSFARAAAVGSFATNATAASTVARTPTQTATQRLGEITRSWRDVALVAVLSLAVVVAVAASAAGWLTTTLRTARHRHRRSLVWPSHRPWPGHRGLHRAG